MAKMRPNTINYFVLATLVNEDDQDTEGIVEVLKRVEEELNEFPGPRRSGVINKRVFSVYSKANTATDFALRLLNWAQDHDIEVRIALEAVLMSKKDDVITVIANTSSLKTIAFTGACYATMQFAAALSAEQPQRYDYNHVGNISYGEIDEGQEIYRIDRKLKTALSYIDQD